MEYPYTNKIIDEKNKYGFNNNNEPVDAIYTPAHLDCDKGNPFIEALPGPVTKDAIKNLYFIPYLDKCTYEAPVEEQLLEVQRLKDIRMPLPFLPIMEYMYHDALMMSHRRRFKDLRNRPFNITIQDRTEVQNVGTKTALGGDTGIGLTLLGIGGCGKSEAISRMLSRYPQIIHHSIKNVGEFIQVVWLNVITPANANLTDLYISIAEALDEALDNMQPIYSELIKKEKSVGAKAKFIAKLIRLFNISSIILDEIQNLLIGKNQVTSYNSLMEIINTTKIALVLVGTEEAYTKLCAKYYLARRTGNIIDASEYCQDVDAFNSRMKYIMHYNWFRPDVKMAPEYDILKELYRQTRGVIDRMISLWANIQIEYITAKIDDKPAITPTFIQLVSNSTNPILAPYTQQTLENSPLIMNPTDSKEDPVEIENDEYINARQHMAENMLMEILEKSEQPKLAERIYKRVKDALILMGTPYNDRNILEKTISVMKRKNSANLTEDELAQNTIKALKRNPSDARAKPKLPSIDKEAFVKNFINQVSK